MYCMKCGREVEGEEVFCSECLEQMEQEPIPMQASVKIPRQPPKDSRPRRPVVYLEEQVKRLERANERMRIWVILLAMATILLAMAIYHKEVVQVVEDLGKNYSIIESGIHRGPR